MLYMDFKRRYTCRTARPFNVKRNAIFTFCSFGLGTRSAICGENSIKKSRNMNLKKHVTDQL